MAIEKLSFFARDTVTVARDLLGKKLVHRTSSCIISGIIVETEAYISSDPACHGYRGMTPRCAALFGPVGHAYVYFTYGNHYCMNIVSHDKSVEAGGVLIRALQPIDGIAIMKKNRKMSELKNLTNGPGKLAQALEIDKSCNGLKLTRENGLYVEDALDVAQDQIIARPRIGISQNVDVKWRFIIKGSEFVSRK